MAKLYAIDAWKIDFSNPAFQEKLKKNLRNALIFIAPPTILVLVDLQAGKGVDMAVGYYKVWAIGVVLDFFMKLKQDAQIKK